MPHGAGEAEPVRLQAVLRSTRLAGLSAGRPETQSDGSRTRLAWKAVVNSRFWLGPARN